MPWRRPEKRVNRRHPGGRRREKIQAPRTFSAAARRFFLPWEGVAAARFSLCNPHLEVRYEDLVNDLESAARRALEFLEVPWDPRVLRFISSFGEAAGAKGK